MVTGHPELSEVEDERYEGFAIVRALAGLISDSIIKAVNQINEYDNEAIITGIYGTVSAPGQVKPESRPGQPFPLDFSFQDRENSEIRLGLIKINDIAFAGISGEIMCSIGMDIRDEMKKRGVKFPVVLTQCNGSNSYMGDDEAYDLKKFAAIASYMKKGIAGILTNGIAELTEKLM